LALAVLRKALGALAVAAVGLVAAGAGLAWYTAPPASPDHVLLSAKTAFTQGPYFAYSQPWGGESSRLTRWWAPHADTMAINLERFPNDTIAYWRWPPIKPRNGPGVWSYQALMHGNYDGGGTEVEVKPTRVHDLKRFAQDFAWSMDAEHGDANVLTEFYLRSSATDVEARLIEIGWFFHMPDSSRKFFLAARKLGTYVDPQGRKWEVRIEDKFCMFAPEQLTDIRSGTLDMRAAMAWLEQQGTITGDEWVWGVAFGLEAVKGFGKLDIQRWSVARE
jgi:hypothetical protein